MTIVPEGFGDFLQPFHRVVLRAYRPVRIFPVLFFQCYQRAVPPARAGMAASQILRTVLFCLRSSRALHPFKAPSSIRSAAYYLWPRRLITE